MADREWMRSVVAGSTSAILFTAGSEGRHGWLSLSNGLHNGGW